MIAKIPIVLDPHEGGYTVTSPLLPDLVTEVYTVSEALANVEDAFAAVAELYQDMGRTMPSSIYVNDENGPVSVEAVVAAP